MKPTVSSVASTVASHYVHLYIILQQAIRLHDELYFQQRIMKMQLEGIKF